MSYSRDAYNLAENLFFISYDFSNSLGNYIIYTHDRLSVVYLTNVIYYYKSLSGTQTSGPSFTIGTTAPNYNDWIGSTAVQNLSVSGFLADNFFIQSQLNAAQFGVGSLRKSLRYNESLYLRITSAGNVGLNLIVTMILECREINL